MVNLQGGELGTFHT